MVDEVRAISHVTEPLTGGGEVLVLNTGAIITPEAQAMLAALHSRSIGGIRSHLQVLADRGAEKFMSTYYVGYGHKSIGDTGSATLFIEGVSMLAAKAIQDWPLYSGQEASTRYINFAEQKFADPVGTPESTSILEAWRTFYLEGLTILHPDLMIRFPKAEEENEKVYEKAIAARAFDIMRAYLPAGATTNVAWHGNLRQFADKILLLRHHLLEEVRDIAEAMERALLTAFPSSFSAKRYEGTENYNELLGKELTYFDDPSPVDFELSRDNVDRATFAEYKKILEVRPPKTELPKQLREAGALTFRFLLDFGSFRDLQRHRAVTTRMPLITANHGFEPWHLSELPTDYRKVAEDFIAAQLARIKALGVSRELQQYYLPMGMRTTIRMTGDLHALVYLAELRATRFVHPTLRIRASQLAQALSDAFSNEGLVLHLDPDPDRFDAKRGEHDIVRTDTTNS